MSDAQALGQQQPQLGAEPAAPMLKSERSCGKPWWKNSTPVKYWKYGSYDPTRADLLIGQYKDVLEQQQQIMNLAGPGGPTLR
jgi:hypothetical protein